MLKKLWFYLSTRRKEQFWLILILMLVSSVAEVVSIGAILPFLSALANPDQFYNSEIVQPLIQVLNIADSQQFILLLTIVFIISALLAGVIRISLLYVMTRLSYATGADLSIDIYRRTLYQGYLVHVKRNSSEVIDGIINKTGVVVGGVITPFLTLVSSAILLIGIISALLVVNVEVALTTLCIFGVFYYGTIRYTRSKLENNSKIISKQSTLVIKSLQEGLGGIRDVLINGSQRFYCDLYRSSDLPLRRASGDNQFISGSPRYAMEAIGMSLIAILAYVLMQKESSVSTVIPTLGVLALAAQRLLPALQQSYSAYSTMKGSRSSFKDVLDFLDQPIPDYTGQNPLKTISFRDGLYLKNLSFRYSKNTPWILKNINLSIAKGERVGFIGETGSGKSTLLDIIMGLLSPSTGKIAVDNQFITSGNIREWQKNIAHVPQNVYLSDSTIEENIAFGVPKEKINHLRVKKAAEKAKISDMISEWELKYQTFVGEQGAKLSGGQRQRIGIARALYREADVLIFDEATSSLDNKTEREIMREINNLEGDLTILIIAHRLSSLEGCDRIVELGKNHAINIGTYQEMIGTTK